MAEPNDSGSDLKHLVDALPEGATVIGGDDNQYVKLEIDGNTRYMPAATLRTNAQKYEAGDARLRKAHEERLSLQQTMDDELIIGQALKEGVSKRDVEAIKRAFRKAGTPEDSISAMFNDQSRSAGNDGTPGSNDGDTSAMGGAEDDPLLAEVEALQREVADMRAERKREREDQDKAQKRHAVTSAVAAAVDSDPALSRIMAGKDAETQSLILGLAEKFVATARQTLPWGPPGNNRALQEGMKVLKAKLNALGVKAGDSEGTLGEGPIPDLDAGLGPAGHSVGHIHQTQGEPKKVGMRENQEEYKESLVARLAHRLRERAKARPRT